MTTATAARAQFNNGAAADVARSVDAGFTAEKSPSARFACFGDEKRLLFVAGEQEARAIELALAYGLSWAGDRQLVLALPEHMSTATAQRIPWLRPERHPTLWLHDGRSARPASERTQAETTESLRAMLASGSPEDEFRKASTAHHLRERGDWVTELVDRATLDTRLDAAHTQGERSWHHRGQRVLSMTRSADGVRVRAGIHYSDAERAPREWLLTGTLTDELPDILAAIDEAIAARADGDDPAIRRDDEHLLQSVIRQSPAVVGIEQQAMREVPAWRPTDHTNTFARGFIDLLGLDGNGDIVVVETKIEKNADPLFVLQGLDYFVWAQTYRAALIGRLGASQSARIRLNLVIGAHSAGVPHVPDTTRALAAALDDSVTWSAQLVRAWSEPGALPVGERLELET
jgi:hypothetical protein